jgi:hypothetical protein
VFVRIRCSLVCRFMRRGSLRQALCHLRSTGVVLREGGFYRLAVAQPVVGLSAWDSVVESVVVMVRHRGLSCRVEVSDLEHFDRVLGGTSHVIGPGVAH